MHGGDHPPARGSPPFSGEEVEALSRAASPSLGVPFRLARVCRLLERGRSTIYARRQRQGHPVARRKPGPKPAWTDGALVGEIRQVLAASPFTGEGHRKVWARLRFAGVRTSRARVLGLMREHGLLAPTRAGHPHGPRAHDGTIVTERPDEMWGTDATSTLTLEEGNATIFVAVDHATTECVGIHAARPGTRWEALEPVRQGVKASFGSYGPGVARRLVLRHDHGSQYVSDVFQEELRFLGIESSPAYVREPEGNGCAERFIRTLKEQLLWVRVFRTVEELRVALLQFRERYNWDWILERHGYLTPSQARAKLLAVTEAAA